MILKKNPLCEPKTKNRLKKLEKQLIQCEEKDDKYKEGVSFISAENDNLIQLDGDFLQLLVSLNNKQNPNSKNLVVNLDEGVFEAVFTHLAMDKFYKKFSESD